MATDPGALRIVHFPAAVLRQRAGPVGEITPEVRVVAQRMIELMIEAEGVGLAAPQVGLPWRLFVAHVPENEERSAGASPVMATAVPVVYVNPRLSSPEGEAAALEEGCLSLPDIRGDVLRPPVVTITAADLAGREFTQRGGGLLARCWQHEIDHLDGVLIIDRMTQMSRLKNRAALRGLERAEKPGRPGR